MKRANNTQKEHLFHIKWCSFEYDGLSEYKKEGIF